MAMNAETQQPGCWSRLGRAIAVLLRLTFVVVIAILIGVGIYYGVPWVYWRLVIPVQDSAARIEMLQRDLENTRADWNTELTEQGQRLSALESDLAVQRERITALEGDMGRMDELLTAQGETLSELQTALDSTEETTGQLRGDVEALYVELDTLRDEIADPNRVAAAFERRLILLQAWGEILKARQHLLEDNPGNARQALALARANLERVILLSPEPEAEALIAIRERLDAADTAIEERPFVAMNELEITWRDLDTFITSEKR
jgi:septal ring factor EnvC (AmiA/AmiB activator)